MMLRHFFRSPRWLSLVALVVAVLHGVSIASAQGPLPSGNLVFNPSAQNGTSGWSLEGQFSVRSLAMPGSPDSLSFWGGTSAVARGTQLIDVRNWADKIGQSCVEMTLSALLGGWQNQTDSATVRVDFLTSDFFTISSVTIGPVTNAERGNTTRMLSRSGTWMVPASTGYLRVVVTSTRGSGTNNDGYADDISVVLFTASPSTPPPEEFPIVQDSPAIAALGGALTLSVADPLLIGQCGLYYQWYQNNTPISDVFGGGRTVLGANSAFLTISPLTLADLNAIYRLRVVPVSDGANFGSSNARTSRPIFALSECQILAAPTVSPSISRTPRGGNAILRLAAPVPLPSFSGGPVTYQWSRVYYPLANTPPITIPISDGVSDDGQFVSGATTPTLRLSNMQHFSDGKRYPLPGGAQGIGDYSVYRLSATTLCGTRSVNAFIQELDPAEPGPGFVPESSSLSGFINSGSSGGAVTGSIVRKVASGGGSTGGGFGFASASIAATISPTPYGSLLEVTRVGEAAGDGTGTVFMTLALEVDERTVWTIEPAGASPNIVVGSAPDATSGVIRPSERTTIQISASPSLQGTFVWRMAMARDPRVVDVPLGPFNDSRWEISRVNALGEQWFVPDSQIDDPPAIEIFTVQPSATAGCGSQAFSLSAFTRRFPGLDDFSISGSATAFNPPLTPAQGTMYLAMEALDATEDPETPVASIRFADSSSTEPGSLTLRAGASSTSRTPAVSPAQSFPILLARQAGIAQAESDPQITSGADTRTVRALRIVSGYLPLQCPGEPSGAFESAQFGLAVLSGNRACRADLNFDDVVDDADFVLFATAYSILLCDDWAMVPGCGSDLNDDAVVDDADFVGFAAAYDGLICP